MYAAFHSKFQILGVLDNYVGLIECWVLFTPWACGDYCIYAL